VHCRSRVGLGSRCTDRDTTRVGTIARAKLVGTASANRLRGTTGADLICGLGGGDRITGGAGSDRLFGEQRNDVIDARDGGFDIVGCGPGRDTALADKTDTVRRRLRARPPE
jgi:Ca2+-binding RTX toxin-like protein